MILFMHYLEKKVIGQSERSKDDVLFLFDGAPYHYDTLFKSYMLRKGLHFIFSGPHSYDAAPCEKVFALTKQGALLPHLDVRSEK